MVGVDLCGGFVLWNKNLIQFIGKFAKTKSIWWLETDGKRSDLNQTYYCIEEFRQMKVEKLNENVKATV